MSSAIPPPRLLIVDDGESNRMTLQLLFEDAGYVVETAGSYKEGMQRITDPTAEYNLVILDEHLGDGLGSQLAPIARTSLPRARLLLMSGSLTYAETVIAADRVDAVADKNAEFPEILELVQQLLR
jgi:two-component system, response regulator RegA